MPSTRHTRRPSASHRRPRRPRSPPGRRLPPPAAFFGPDGAVSALRPVCALHRTVYAPPPSPSVRRLLVRPAAVSAICHVVSRRRLSRPRLARTSPLRARACQPCDLARAHRSRAPPPAARRRRPRARTRYLFAAVSRPPAHAPSSPPLPPSGVRTPPLPLSRHALALTGPPRSPSRPSGAIERCHQAPSCPCTLSRPRRVAPRRGASFTPSRIAVPCAPLRPLTHAHAVIAAPTTPPDASAAPPRALKMPPAAYRRRLTPTASAAPSRHPVGLLAPRTAVCTPCPTVWLPPSPSSRPLRLFLAVPRHLRAPWAISRPPPPSSRPIAPSHAPPVNATVSSRRCRLTCDGAMHRHFAHCCRPSCASAAALRTAALLRQCPHLALSRPDGAVSCPNNVQRRRVSL
ncbi:hypothetical protein DENSPDRAFT_886780 [Dentipellis sp. KUC8613]|nr:hypothetical protein DENSPDRAFT_886780 [Dentipellis sp. KUC8613]